MPIGSTPAAPIAASGLAPVAFRQLNIAFTGSGSEYFRIWIVNLLLILVTLGLYIPFAKARRIRYFYANTLIDGQALGFHGQPWKMFRGFILLVVLMGAYGIAGRFSPVAALIAFIVLCAVWPALWRASMQFRLANTSWRGLRMAFDGDLKEAYRAVAPLYIPLMALLGTTLFAEQTPGNRAYVGPDIMAALSLQAMMMLAALLVVIVMTPWFLALTKRYQHRGLRMAGQRTQVDLPAWRMYALCAKGVLMGLLPAVLAGVLVAVLGPVVAALLGSTAKAWVFGITMAALLLCYGFWFVVAWPYFAARMQNLVWNATRSQAVSFSSQLSFRALCWLTLSNWTLVVLTLGLYRPFAAVDTARLRLEAVSLTITEDVNLWTAGAPSGMQDASGDIAGDFFGIDMGL